MTPAPSRRQLLLALGALLGLLSGACGVLAPRQVVVSVASSLAPAMEPLEEAFEAAHPDQDLVAHIDGTAAVVARTLEGAPTDVLLVDDAEVLAEVTAGGLGLGEPIPVAGNTLAIVVPAGNPDDVRTLADLADLDVALAVPDIPVGAAAQAVLDAAGVRLQPVSLEPSAQAVVARVAVGDAQAGIAHLSDGAAEAILAVAIAPDVRITYEVLLLSERGEAFLEFLVTDDAREILRDHGFPPAS